MQKFLFSLSSCGKLLFNRPKSESPMQYTSKTLIFHHEWQPYGACLCLYAVAYEHSLAACLFRFGVCARQIQRQHYVIRIQYTKHTHTHKKTLRHTAVAAHRMLCVLDFISFQYTCVLTQSKLNDCATRLSDESYDPSYTHRTFRKKINTYCVLGISTGCNRFCCCCCCRYC